MFLKKKIILIVFALSLIFVFLYKNQNNSSNSQIGGNFELTNHLGQKVTNESFNGYYRLVFFGFTNCPDFCPNTLNNIGIIIDEIDKNDLLVPIFITVDPERDTVLKLKNYLSNFNSKIIGLSGTNLQIDIGSSGRIQGAGGNGRQGTTSSGKPSQAFTGTSGLGIEYPAQINNSGT